MELVGYLNPGDPSYQPAYFSQLYGTFFGLFVKFNVTEDETSYAVDSLEFGLLNYKGLINLGISDVQGPIKDDEDEDLIKINIELQALRKKDEWEHKWECPDIKLIKRESVLEFDRTLKRLPEEIYGGIFDEEFYYREGIPEFENRTVKPAETWKEFNERYKNQDNLTSKSFAGTLGGSICPRSMNKII